MPLMPLFRVALLRPMMSEGVLTRYTRRPPPFDYEMALMNPANHTFEMVIQNKDYHEHMTEDEGDEATARALQRQHILLMQTELHQKFEEQQKQKKKEELLLRGGGGSKSSKTSSSASSPGESPDESANGFSSFFARALTIGKGEKSRREKSREVKSREVSSNRGKTTTTKEKREKRDSTTKGKTPHHRSSRGRGHKK